MMFGPQKIYFFVHAFEFAAKSKIYILLLSYHQYNYLLHQENMSVHFYIEKLGYEGVYLFFLFLLQNIDCGYSLEPPRRGGSNEYPQSMFWGKNKKNIKNFPMKFSFLH